MKHLVGNIPMEAGQKVIIIFSDGNRQKAIYKETFGYNHSFQLEGGNSVTLSNHFMRLKGIRVIEDQ